MKKNVNEEYYWKKIHDEGYSHKVFSVSDTEEVKEKISTELDRLHSQNILICGSGINTELPRKILNENKIKNLTCTDFQSVIRIVDDELTEMGAITKGWDFTSAPEQTKYDCIISINSIISSNHETNLKSLINIRESLSQGGAFLCLMPTVFVDFDFEIMGEPLNSVVDYKKNLAYEVEQDDWQLHYTPLKIKEMFRAASFEIDQFEIMFFESESSKNRLQNCYGRKSQNSLYEFFIVAH